LKSCYTHHMHELQQLILDHLPTKRKVTNKGWIWFNAPCCTHKGHNADTRLRGNLWFGTDATVGYHCFNCGCKWRFSGHHVTDALQEWLSWLGVSSEQVQTLKLHVLQHQIQGACDQTPVVPAHLKRHQITPLPPQSDTFESWATKENPPDKFLQACAYVQQRRALNWESYSYYWSPDTAHDMCDRVILPFYNQGQIVGWCARLCVAAKPRQPKYFNSDIPPGYLFNQDQLRKDRKWVVICEGPFDAIACQGMAVMGSHMSEYQIKTVLDSGQQPIILPDREDQNQHMIDQALTFGWAVSFPEWDADVKDASQACVRYGAIYTITSIMQAATSDPILIGVKRKMFRG
jgi:hypothetical protein